MKRAIAKSFGGVGGLLGLASGGLWILSANAQRYGMDPLQSKFIDMWNAQSADLNFLAAVLSATAAMLSGLAVFLMTEPRDSVINTRRPGSGPAGGS